MNKKIFLIVIPILIAIVIIIQLQKSTVIETVIDVTHKNYEVLNIYSYGNRSIVLRDAGDDFLEFHVVKSGFIKNKIIYSGYSGDYSIVLERLGIEFYELPRTIMNNKHICFGLVDDIAMDKIVLSDNEKEVVAELTPIGSMIYWSADISDFNNKAITINGYGSEGQQLLEYETVFGW